MATTIDVFIDGSSSAVEVTVECDVQCTEPPYGDKLKYTAKATPDVTERSGTGQSMDAAIYACSQAIVDVDEVP